MEGLSVEDLPAIPQGPMILLKTRKFETKSAGGIIHTLSNEAERETAGQSVYQVVAQGELAYKDHPTYKDAVFCEVGDWVCAPRYAGLKMPFKGEDGELYYLANDDDVKGIVLEKNLSKFDIGGSEA